jgi:hypothetical protein
MKTEALMIAGIAAAAMLAAGSALAQSPGPDVQGPSSMQQQGQSGTGPGMMQNMPREMSFCMGMMQRMGMVNGMMQSRLGLTQLDPAQIETLKTSLGITAAQEAAWSKYSNVLRDVATTMKSAREAAKTAADELLTGLDEEQKAKAREALPGLATPGPSMMGGMGGANRNAH